MYQTVAYIFTFPTCHTGFRKQKATSKLYRYCHYCTPHKSFYDKCKSDGLIIQSMECVTSVVQSIPSHWPCNCSVLTFPGQMVQISWELLKLQPPAINCSHQYTVPAVRASHCPLIAWMDTCSSGKCVSTELWPCTNHTLTGTPKWSWRLRSMSGVSYSKWWMYTYDIHV